MHLIDHALFLFVVLWLYFVSCVKRAGEYRYCSGTKKIQIVFEILKFLYSNFILKFYNQIVTVFVVIRE
jgi:hypothetical protein